MKNTILLVDDYPCIRELLKLVLDKMYIIIEASNGREALSILNSRNDVGMVLLDYSMPEMNGLDTLKGIKAINKNIPVCMVSSENDPTIVTEAKRLGAVEYIVKPFDVKTIAKIVRSLL
ncbi:MAG: response regulator [Candidatus Margulisiibacteriota bacterium]|nr:MAG: hypothetical protein A2X43_05960 [Candidatus Margulisbacteria bacterium GWD2_39_127]OGI02676.1 MAG: hypothetical protein A2X42_00325 [Candidatus Margulisbacteria bacterium GWF2_38_17]OGI05939.1 MAG: hypothetical protein A2X41_07660 [Candidatus Margulisbacteria bacterium GWE2_39_32]PZM80007.1 MAG: response regulator [Candidatus Margulisiibacteriota bacterium]HAR62588.1 response regulator [Candidatus Margulisiibacteriota bacterium]